MAEKPTIDKDTAKKAFDFVLVTKALEISECLAKQLHAEKQKTKQLQQQIEIMRECFKLMGPT